MSSKIPPLRWTALSSPLSPLPPPRCSAEARVDKVEPIAPQARAREVLMRMRSSPHLIKDRRKHMRKHRSCFLGNEFITWAITCELCASREAGVHLGQLLIDHKLIHRVGSKR